MKMKNICLRTMIYALLGIFASSPLFGQDLPISGQVLESQRQQEERRDIPSVPSEIVKPTEEIVDKGVKIFVKSFVFTGEISVFTEPKLQAQVADAIGKQLSLKELKNVAARISTLYHEHGYFLSQVILPPQDVTEGVVTLQIVEGRRDGAPAGIEIKGEKLRISSEYLKAIIDTAVPANQPIQQLSLERGVLLITDLPGVHATVNLEPGEEAGTTRMILDVIEGPRYDIRIGFDNSGSRLLGAWRATSSVNFNDLMGWGEQLTTYYAKSVGSGDMDYLNLGYTHPVGAQGLRFGVNYSYMPYDVGKEFASLNASGTAETWSADAYYPLIRNRLTNVKLRAGLDLISLEDKVGSTKTGDSDIVAARFGIQASHVDNFWGGGFTEGGMTFHQGDLDLSGTASAYAADQSATGTHSHGIYRKIRWNARRIQRGSKKYLLFANIKGQTAFDNLGSSEKFQLGGPYGVRAYPVGEAVGDSGFIATLEGQYATKTPKHTDVRLIAFYDWGYIRQNHDASNLTMTTPNSYHLHGYGLGVKVSQQGKYDVSLTWARRIGKNPARNPMTGDDSDGSLDRNRFWFSAVYYF